MEIDQLFSVDWKEPASEQEREPPFQIYPRELVSMCICKEYAEGDKTFMVRDIADTIPTIQRATTEEGLSLLDYTEGFANLAHGNHSNQVSSVVSSFEINGLTFSYDREKYILTPVLVEACREEVALFYKRRIRAARVLATTLDTTCEELLFGPF